MGTKMLSIALMSLLILISPTLATHYLYGVNDTLSFSYGAFDQALVLNGSLVCTAGNGLCVTNISGLNSGYNTSDSTWIYNGSSGLTANQTTLNATYQKRITNNCTGDEYPQGFYTNGTPICHTPTDTNTMYTASGLLLQLGGTTFSVKEGNMTEGAFCKYNSSIGLWCNSTVSFTDTNCNTTNSCPTIIYDNNGSWLVGAIGNATAVNSSLQIEISARGSLGNWSADKSGYINSTQLDNSSIIRSVSGLINTTQFDNSTIIRSLSGYYNAMANISTYLTNGKYCFYNSSALKFECTGTMTVDTNDTARVDSLNSTLISANGNITLETSNRQTNDTALNNSQVWQNGTWVQLKPGITQNVNVSNVLFVNGSNVGIGTTLPNQKLEVNGSANVSGTIYENGISLNTKYNDTSAISALYTNASRYYGSNTTLILDSNKTWITGAVGNATAVNTTANIASLGFFNNSLNDTTYVVDGKYCFWNATAGKKECTGSVGTDTNDTTAVNLLTSRVNNLTYNCTAGNFIKGYDANEAPICDAPGGSGDITSVQSYDPILYNGTDSGDVKLRINGTMINLTTAAYSASVNGNWSKDKENYYTTSETYSSGYIDGLLMNSGDWDSAYGWGYYGANQTLLTTSNGSYIASTSATANGNWSADKSSYFTKTDSYTNLSYAGATYNWVNTNHTYWDLAYSNMNQYYANASTYPGVQAALYTNITGINTTSSIQKLLALSNITVTNITLSEAGHTLKSYWNGTMWIEVVT